MNISRYSLHVFDWRGGQDPMTQIEDVTSASFRSRQHIVGRRERPIERAEKNRRIQIPLHCSVEADAQPCFVERRPPINSNHAAAGVS